MRVRQSFWSSLLHSEIKKIIPSHLRPRAPAYILAAVLLAFLVPAASTALAGSATWNLNPTSGDWNTAGNWTPASVPDGPSDTATFDISNITVVSLSAQTEVNGIVFDVGANAYTISTFSGPTTISGVGINNMSGITQNISVGRNIFGLGILSFTNNATAGRLIAFTTVGASDSGGDTHITFSDTSSAGSGTFTNNGSHCSECGFFAGGSTDFSGSSTANNATLIAYAGSDLWGGRISFSFDSTGDRARVEVFGDGSGLTLKYGYLDISGHNAPGVTVGSIEGSGDVFLGANNLTVGSNNLSTSFSGAIQDGEIYQFGGGPGSLTKVGTGRLVLTYENPLYDAIPYTGGTTIEQGELAVNNMTGSGTGTGAVRVNGGILAGTGIIAGPVVVGTGGGAGAALAPGETTHKAGTLTIQSALTFNSDATYKCELKTKGVIADKVVANGVAINGARISFVSCGNSAIPPGTVFTVIDNTATTPIAGTFVNVADGSTLIGGSNTYLVSYEGGDGNDLTLTVQ